MREPSSNTTQPERAELCLSSTEAWAHNLLFDHKGLKHSLKIFHALSLQALYSPALK